MDVTIWGNVNSDLRNIAQEGKYGDKPLSIVSEVSLYTLLATQKRQFSR